MNCITCYWCKLGLPNSNGDQYYGCELTYKQRHIIVNLNQARDCKNYEDKKLGEIRFKIEKKGW